jgi:hypothetical protein
MRQLVTHPDKAKSNRFVRVNTLGLERAPQGLEVRSMLLPSFPRRCRGVFMVAAYLSSLVILRRCHSQSETADTAEVV